MLVDKEVLRAVLRFALKCFSEQTGDPVVKYAVSNIFVIN
jgi:hypothetical protein